MKTNHGPLVPWRERIFVSKGEAAEIFARSKTWVDDRIREGRLVVVQLASGGPFVVTVASVLELAREAAPPRPDQLAALRQRSGRESPPALRLIINNGP